MFQVLAAGALALATVPFTVAQSSGGVKGTDILNFALNLECLEAAFYHCAVYGKNLPAAALGYATDADVPEGTITPCPAKAKLTKFGEGTTTFGSEELAMEIAEDELAHVTFLRTALKEAAVKCPKMDISGTVDGAFNAAALAALNKTKDEQDSENLDIFDPYAGDLYFLHGAFIFEDVGVTAYTGAVPAAAMLLPPAVVQAAASILGVESYHAGIVRARLQAADKESGPTAAYGKRVSAIVGAISDLRDSVDGVLDEDQGIVKVNGDSMMPNLVPTDKDGLVYARSIANVLKIVYLGGATKGGFFPDGINGAFKDLTSEQLTELFATMTDAAESPPAGSGSTGTGVSPNVDGTSGALGLLAGAGAGIAALAAVL